MDDEHEETYQAHLSPNSSVGMMEIEQRARSRSRKNTQDRGYESQGLSKTSTILRVSGFGHVVRKEDREK